MLCVRFSVMQVSICMHQLPIDQSYEILAHQLVVLGILLFMYMYDEFQITKTCPTLEVYGIAFESPKQISERM